MAVVADLRDEVQVRQRRSNRPWSIALLTVTAAAWIVSIAAEVTGRGALLHHDHLLEGGPPLVLAAGLFLAAWLVMIAAMMLPSSLGMVSTFAWLARTQLRPRLVTAVFVGAYLVAWTAFGFVAFVGDGFVHRTVDAWPWLHAHEWLIAAGVLIAAGAFQFSDLKDRCLTACRTPLGFLVERYRPGTGGAFRVGLAHAVNCIGCCWALMLVAFATGVANLAWMAALTSVMVIERAMPAGRAIVRPAGIAFLVLGGLVLLHPSWLPPVLGG